MKRIRILLFAAILFSVVFTTVAYAQSNQLVLKLSRDFGYGGFSGDIQGLFTMRVTGPADLSRVEFYIDDTKIGEVGKSPYNFQFTTDTYPLGNHRLYATGYSTGGQVYQSNVLTATFVLKQSVMKTILPVLGAILLVVLLSALVPLLATRKKHANIPLGTQRNYGSGGGGICPNCHRPFALPLLSANLGFSKLAACPFCGKVSMIRVESIARLRDAEKAELEWAKPENPLDQSEAKRDKDLDESKYQGL